MKKENINNISFIDKDDIKNKLLKLIKQKPKLSNDFINNKSYKPFSFFSGNFFKNILSVLSNEKPKKINTKKIRNKIEKIKNINKIEKSNQLNKNLSNNINKNTKDTKNIKNIKNIKEVDNKKQLNKNIKNIENVKKVLNSNKIRKIVDNKKDEIINSKRIQNIDAKKLNKVFNNKNVNYIRQSVNNIKENRIKDNIKKIKDKQNKKYPSVIKRDIKEININNIKKVYNDGKANNYNQDKIKTIGIKLKYPSLNKLKNNEIKDFKDYLKKHNIKENELSDKKVEKIVNFYKTVKNTKNLGEYMNFDKIIDLYKKNYNDLQNNKTTVEKIIKEKKTLVKELKNNNVPDNKIKVFFKNNIPDIKVGNDYIEKKKTKEIGFNNDINKVKIPKEKLDKIKNGIDKKFVGLKLNKKVFNKENKVLNHFLKTNLTKKNLNINNTENKQYVKKTDIKEKINVGNKNTNNKSKEIISRLNKIKERINLIEFGLNKSILKILDLILFLYLIIFVLIITLLFLISSSLSKYEIFTNNILLIIGLMILGFLLRMQINKLYFNLGEDKEENKENS